VDSGGVVSKVANRQILSATFQERVLLIDIGKTVQQLREAQGLSLQDLGSRAGVTASFLSQMENGKCSVSITTLDRIALALGVTISHFFPLITNHRTVTRSGERTTFAANHSLLSYEALSGDFPSRTLEAFLIHMEPGEIQDQPFRHDGEEFGYVLEGTLTLRIGQETYELHPGDTIHFPSTDEHMWQNTGNRPVLAVWVNTHRVT